MSMAQELAGKTCEPCRGGVAAMSRAEAEAHLPAIPGWTLGEEPLRLTRRLSFADFKTAQDFALRVGAVCEAEGHHADIAYGWGYCAVTFWTHKINGLHENDFIMAARVDRLGG